MLFMRRSLWILLLLGSAALLNAQFDSGTVLGTIRDTNGGVLPDVSITLESLGTGTSRATLSNGAGAYTFTSVPPGDYVVKANRATFRSITTSAFTVSVGEPQRVDLTFYPETANQQVTVAASAVLLETDSSDRSMLVNPTEVVNLPLNGRDPADLSLIVPGVNKSSLEIEGATSREASYNVNGLRTAVNSYLLDGLDNTSWVYNDIGWSSQETELSPDALAEFRLTTGDQSAEFGRAAGAVVNEVSKRGGNEYHGATWEYLRNTVLNASGPIPPTGGQKPALEQNQFGADIGGPVIRGKMFLFGDYEGFRRDLRTALSATLPTAAQAAGQFVDSQGNPIPITDPYTNAVYANGVIPIAALEATDIPGTTTPEISSLDMTVLGLLPTGSLASQVSGVGNNYISFPRGTENIDKGDARVDLNFSPKMTSFVRYSQRNFNAIDPAPIPAPIFSAAKGFLAADNKQLAAGYVWQLTNASALDARAAFSFNTGSQEPLSAGQPFLPALAGEPNEPTDPSFASGLNFVSVKGFTQFGRTDGLPALINPFAVDPKVNYSWLKGRHSFKFGYEWLRESAIVNNFNPVSGDDTYGGKFSKGKTAYTGTDPSYNEAWNLADFIFGARSQYELAAHHVVEYNQRIHSFYAQDDWHIASKLTLNMGIRYENATPPYETNNQLSNFDPVNSPTTGQLILASGGSIDNRALVNRNNMNFAPRFGFAWSLMPKTVLRGAYGISYQQFIRGGPSNELANNAPYNIDNVITQNAPASKTAPQNVCTSSDASPLSCFQPTQAGIPNNFLVLANSSPLVTTTQFNPARTRTPYVQSYQLSVQRQLARGTSLDVAYVGNYGVHLQTDQDYNQAVPNASGGTLSVQARRPIATFGAIQESANEAPSRYNALEAKFEKRYSGGLYVANSFTWSHAQDEASALPETGNNDTTFVDHYNPLGSYTRSMYDRPLNDSLAVVYDLPFGKDMRFGSNAPTAMQYVIGGWQLTTLNWLISGSPINISYAPSTAQQITTLGKFPYRPNLVGTPVLSSGNRTPITGQPGQYKYLDPAAVTIPTDASTPNGNAPRNVARAPGLADLDLGLHKRIPLGFEKVGLDFRVEAFNALNRPNAQAPDGVATDAGYGIVSSYFPSRELQGALKLVF
ncbi:MAG: TonB-dependent receptor [Terracidiphilus sp.]